MRLGCPLKRAIRLYTVAAPRLACPCRRANRAASSNPARCFRHWRRFAGFHYAQVVFRRAPVAAENDQDHLCLRALGQPLAALLLYGCRMPLAGKNCARLPAREDRQPLFLIFLQKKQRNKKVSKNLANDEAAEYTIKVKDLRFDIPAQRQEGEITYAE